MVFTWNYKYLDRIYFFTKHKNMCHANRGSLMTHSDQEVINNLKEHKRERMIK